MTRRISSPSRRPAILAIAAVTLVAVLGAFLARGGAGGDTTPTPAAAGHRADRAPSGSGGNVNDVADVRRADEPSAVAAALRYAAAAQDWLYLTDDEVRAAVTSIATPAAATVLADDVVAGIAMARSELGSSPGRVWWLVRPLAWRVEQYGEARARVSVWTITILSATGVALPQSEYVTVAFDLEWVDGRWLVDAVRDTPGPTSITGPKDQPWDAATFDDALAGFTRIGEEPRS